MQKKSNPLRDVIVVGFANRTNPNELAVTFLKGASAMGGICLMIGFAKVVGIVLTDGKILHTIAYAAVNVIGGLGSAVAEVVSEACPVPVIRLGTEDRFGHSGKVPPLLEMYGLTVQNLVAKAELAVSLKK